MTKQENVGLSIRRAERSDVPRLLQFIRELAAYERLLDEVSATVEDLEASLFGERSVAEALLGFLGEDPVCFAIYFHNFSTFVGKPGLYLEDLFVKPEHRGRGYGTALLAHLARMARERGCGRFEWAVLDWNEDAIRFYRSLGAEPMEDWTVYRVSGRSLDRLAERA